MDKMLEMVMARAVCTVPVMDRAPTGPKEAAQAKALAAARMPAAVRAKAPERALATAAEQAKAAQGTVPGQALATVQALAAVAAMVQATAAAPSRRAQRMPHAPVTAAFLPECFIPACSSCAGLQLRYTIGIRFCRLRSHAAGVT